MNKVPHIKHQYAKGNPGYPIRFKPGAGASDIGEYLFIRIVWAALIWFIATMLC